MNATTHPEYVGDATVIDRAEFARLIRKFKGLRVHVHASNYNDVAYCSSGCFGVMIPVKKAIEMLERCGFDAFGWQIDEFGPHIWHYAAPRRQQLLRRREFLVARIPRTEERILQINVRLAQPSSDNEWHRKIRDDEVAQVASDRAEIAQLDARIAFLKSAA